MICVECAAPVDSLYTVYSEDNIRATKCAHCGKFADKYIECDRIVTFIDLLLLKKAAVRHVVFNAITTNATSSSSLESIGASEHGSQGHGNEPERKGILGIAGVPPIVRRMIVFVMMLDIYLLWAISERSMSPLILHFLVVTHPAVQYSLFLVLCLCDTIAVNLVVRSMARYLVGWQDGGAISTSLMIGSFFRLLPILTLIWHYDIPFAEQVVQYFSLFCKTEILSIIIGCSYVNAAILTLAARLVSVLLDKLFWKICLSVQQ